MMLSVYQCYHILKTAKKGLNVGNIVYEHKQFFSTKIHSSIHSNIKTDNILLKLLNVNLLWRTCVRRRQHIRVRRSLKCGIKNKIQNGGLHMVVRVGLR